MDHEIRGAGLDGRLSQLVLAKLVQRVDPLAAFLYIPVDHIQEIQDLQYQVLDGLPEGVELEPVEPENLHITLLYIDEVSDDDLEEFFNRLTTVMPMAFPVEVSHSGTFPEAEDKPVVLHLAASPSLVRLQNELYNTAVELGLPMSVFSKPQNFKPHISLALDLVPPDTPIPDIKQPVRIQIESFTATRPDYERVRTIMLPTMSNETVLVQKYGGSPLDPPGLGGSVPFGVDPAEDRRRFEWLVPQPRDPHKPLNIRILYDPNLEKEAQSVNTFDTFDITLGPRYYVAGYPEEQAGILARALGFDLARRLLLGPGGAHEWQRCDAMMSATPDEVAGGYRYVFANNSLVDAVADTYAVLSLNPEEISQRGYWNASDWIEIAVTEQPMFAPAELPDLHELVDRIGEQPTFPGVTLVIDEASSEPKPSLEDLYAEDEAAATGTASEGMATGTAGEYGISKSDLLHLLRGGSLTYGPLRRTLVLQSGPFMVLDDGQPVQRMEPPEPSEFRPPEPQPEPQAERISIPAPSLRDRIAEVLRGFVSGLGELLGRGGPGSGHFGHEGRPGEVGGSRPSGSAPAPEHGIGPTDAAKALAARFPTVTAEEYVNRHGLSNMWIGSDGRIYNTGQHHLSALYRIREDLGLEAEPKGMTFDQLAEHAHDDLGMMRLNRVGDDVVATFGLADSVSRDQIETLILLATFLHRREGYLELSSWQVAAGDRYEALFRKRQAIRVRERMGEPENIVLRGGRGSGHFGHEGRPGEVGGSQPSGAGSYAEGDYANWTDGDQLVRIVSVKPEAGRTEEQVRVEVVDGPDRGSYYDAYLDDLEEPDDDDLELWTGEGGYYTLQRAVHIFGLTDVPEEAGYLLSDGSMLDFSQKQEGGTPGIRSADHREISRAMLDDEPGGTEGMYYFMNQTGAVRMHVGDDLIVDFAKPPTASQQDALASIALNTGGVIWDMTRYDSVGRRFWTQASGESSTDYGDLEDMFASVRGAYFEARKNEQEEQDGLAKRAFDAIARGGPGSGHFGHEGRPGEVGGSLPGDGEGEVDFQGRPLEPDRVIRGGNLTAAEVELIDVAKSNAAGAFTADDVASEALKSFKAAGLVRALPKYKKSYPQYYTLTVQGNDVAAQLYHVRKRIAREQATQRGGPGSGHFGHEGRPGEVGGSLPSGEAKVTDKEIHRRWTDDESERVLTAIYNESYDHPTAAVNIEQWPGAFWMLPNGLFVHVSAHMELSVALERGGAGDVPNWDESFENNGFVRGYYMPHGANDRRVLLLELNRDELNPGTREALRTMYWSLYDHDKQAEPVVIADWRDNDNNWGSVTTEQRMAAQSADTGGKLEHVEASDLRKVLGFRIDRSVADRGFLPRVRGLLRRIINRGGPGSGHHGHKGRPGEVGGSLPSGKGPSGKGGGLQPFGEGVSDYAEAEGLVPRGESRWIVDQQGETLAFTNLGSPLDRNPYPNTSIDLMAFSGQGVTDIHSHPDNAWPSDGDWSLFGWGHTNQIRVVLQNHDVITVTWNGEGNKPTPRDFKDNWMKYENQIFEERWDEFGGRPVEDMIQWINERMAESFPVTLDVSKVSDHSDEQWAKDVLAGEGMVERGGPGSGHHGHKGRPGEVGGSQPGERNVGITSYKEGREYGEVFDEMRDFADRLESIKTVTEASVRPGLGGWEDNREPTWIVNYSGNGEATKLIAETAKKFDQDGVLLLDPCTGDASDCAPVTDFHFEQPITPRLRGEVENIFKLYRLGGWTWYRLPGGHSTIRSVYIADWTDLSRQEYLDRLEHVRFLFHQAGLRHEFVGNLARVSVMNKEGENSYDRILGSATH